MRSNWFIKCGLYYSGAPSERSFQLYQPEQDGEIGGIYQSSDLPWVFLGSANAEDLKKVEQIAGKPICMRIDLTTANTSHLSQPAIKMPLPEYDMWNQRTFNIVQKQYNKAVETLVQTISSNRNCPIYVHCSLGMNRSAATLAAAIGRITNKSALDVLREMRSQRGVVAPHDPYVSLMIHNNPADQHNKQWARDLQINEQLTQQIA